MMKLMLMMFFFFLYKNKGAYLQLIYQNFILMMLLMMLLFFPMNNLNFWMNLYYFLSIDFYSWGLIILSFWIISLMIMASMKIFLKGNKIYYIYIINFMMIFLFMCFSSLNMIVFYIYFESSLVTIFLLIMGWGFQVERIQASFFMMLYTLLGSLPLLLMMIYLYLVEFSLMMNVIFINSLNIYIYLSLIMAFLIKMPMYFVHLWLPKAHVEAPVVGSMILAGVMLKLGSYGLMRFLLLMLNNCMKFNKYLIVMSLMGGVLSSLICLCQIDMKMLVAYSSIVHMSILMSGVMTLFNWGFIGGYLMMISHGLCSSGLFYLVNVNYERLMSRSLYINKGLMNYMPSLSLMWFLLCSSNMSFPMSLNLMSEIMLLNSLVMWSCTLILILMMILFLSAAYSLFLYSFSQHGKLITNFLFLNVMVLDYFLLMLHWIPLNLMFFLIVMFI